MLWDTPTRTLQAGLLGSVSSVPANYSSETMLFLGPVRPTAPFASRSVRRALLMLQVNPGVTLSLRQGPLRAGCEPLREETGPGTRPEPMQSQAYLFAHGGIYLDFDVETRGTFWSKMKPTDQYVSGRG